jgi:hypothetical protein
MLTFSKKENTIFCWDFIRKRRRLLFIPLAVIFVVALLTFKAERELYPTIQIHPEARYLLQKTYLKYDSSSTEYTIAIVSDMDKKSKIDQENTWRAIMKEGRLTRDPLTKKYSVTWLKEVFFEFSLPPLYSLFSLCFCFNSFLLIHSIQDQYLIHFLIAV